MAGRWLRPKAPRAWGLLHQPCQSAWKCQGSRAAVGLGQWALLPCSGGGQGQAGDEGLGNPQGPSSPGSGR